MQPTQPAAHWGRWTAPPDMSYSFKHRFTFPGGVEGAAAAGEAAAAGAGANAARMAAVGGVPPSVGAYHYHGYAPYGRGFRPRFGLFRRFIWFGLGVGVASWWINRKERQRERERWLNATGGIVPSGSQGEGWGWRHHQGPNNFYRPLPVEPSPSPAPAAPAAPTASVPVDHVLPAANVPLPTAAPAPPVESPVVSETRRGWGRWRERRAEEERVRMAQSNSPLPPATAAPAPVAAAAPLSPPATAQVGGSIDKDEEYRKLKDVVEKLWAAKTSGIPEAQKDANEREYAAEKLDRLSLALDSLRESLRKDASPGGEKKLV